VIVLRPDEMKRVDQLAIKRGFPEFLLMETAGRGVALKAVELMKKNRGKNVLVFAGKGNNGGDGLVAARYLHNYGFAVHVFTFGPEKEFKGSSLKNYHLCCLKGIEIEEINIEESDLQMIIGFSDLIIDAILGTGLSGPAREPAATIINMINNTSKMVLAVDLPSGINGETGKVPGNAILADYTVTMAYPKTGLLLYPGRKYSGEIEVVDLGVPDDYAFEVNPGHFSLSREEAAALLPVRQPDGHKGTFGKVAVIGGSPGMSGAPGLTGMAALRTGAGLVKAGVPAEIEPAVSYFSPELISLILPELNTENHTKYDNKVLDKLMEESDVLAIGPGLGRAEGVKDPVSRVVRDFKGPLIIDADGLNAIDKLHIFKEREEVSIITPHPGEMARLLGMSIEEVQENRIENARSLAISYGIHVVLKGASTVIALPGGNIYINLTGNEGMATAGSGDVLTGVLAGLLAQGLKAEEAAVLGPYLHGLAGDLACEEKGSFSLIAGDLISFLDNAFQKVLDNS